jgi:transglutaminase-like putative cysteine protease
MPRSDASASVSVERFFQFALLGLVASGFLAVAGSGYLDLPTIALTTAGLALRGLMVAGFPRFDLSERAVTVITAIYAAFFLLDCFLISRELLAAAIHLAFFLVVMKALTSKTGRDYLYLAAIAMIELLAAALLSIDLKFFLALALYLFFAIAALTGAEIRRSTERAAATTARDGLRRFHARLALLAGFIAVGIMGLTAAMFLVLPRTADAALSRFARHALFPGFADQVNLGLTGAIENDSRPVMHVRIFGDAPPGVLRWRGGSLADFDGWRWANTDARKTRIAVEDGQADLGRKVFERGRRLEYHVAFDAIQAGTLFFAGVPEKVDLSAPYLVRTEGASYSLDYPIPQGFHYDAYSVLESPPGSSPPLYPPPVLGLADRERNLQLPSHLDGRIPALARAMAGPAATDLEQARGIEATLRRDYGYTLQLPKREPADPLADFLFHRKQGHCEYFASAMTVLLRTAGIPARIVTGFLGGEYNPITDLWVVRASDAHSWVEAWIPGFGWSTFDPTPAAPGVRSFAFVTTLGLYLDAAQTFWQNWVLGYDVGRQGALADRMEQDARGIGIRWYDAAAAVEAAWRTSTAAMTRRVTISLAAAIGVALWIWLAAPPLIRLLRMRRRVKRVRRGQADVGDATMLYQRMLHVLKRQGFQKPAWFTPVEFAATLPHGAMAAAVAEFTSAYNALRFGGRTGAAARLSLLLDEVEKSGVKRPLRYPEI